MKWIIFIMCAVLWAAPLLAETYSWIDENGTYNFTEDYSSIPKKYRKGVGKRGDMDGKSSAPRAVEPDSKAKPLSRAAEPDSTAKSSPKDAAPGSAVQGNEENGLYGGNKPEVWQRDFRVREAEYKQLEQKLVQLEKLIKNPVGISNEKYFALPQEFKETQKQYKEVLKSYNDLNDAANKAGLPAEFRK